MSRNQVTSFAPASIGNVGPGFDVFGLAFERSWRSCGYDKNSGTRG